MHLFFSVTVRRYYRERKILAISGDIPTEGLPTLAEIPVASFAVRHAVCAVLRKEHLVHVEGIPLPIWQTKPFNRSVKNIDSQDLACQGLTFLPLDSASCLIGIGDNISEASCLLFPLITI